MNFSKIKIHYLDWRLASFIAIVLWVPVSWCIFSLLIYVNPLSVQSFDVLGYLLFTEVLIIPLLSASACLVSKPGSGRTAVSAVFVVIITLIVLLSINLDKITL